MSSTPAPTFVRKSTFGFTLIELLIAVVIVAILATIGTNAYFSQIRKSRVATGQQYLQEISAYMERQYLDRRVYPATLPDSLASVPPEIANDYDNPFLAVFAGTPPTFRVFLNVKSTSGILNRFDSSIPPHSLNLAIDSDFNQWFETSTCVCINPFVGSIFGTAILTFTCNWDINRVFSWKDGAGDTAIANKASTNWALATKPIGAPTLGGVPLSCNSWFSVP